MENSLRDDLIEISHEINMARKDIRDGNDGNVDARLVEVLRVLQGYVNFTEYIKAYREKRLKVLRHEIKGLENTATAMGVPHFKQEERIKLEDEIKRVEKNIF